MAACKSIIQLGLNKQRHGKGERMWILSTKNQLGTWRKLRSVMTISTPEKS